jgi:putative transposase
MTCSPHVEDGNARERGAALSPGHGAAQPLAKPFVERLIGSVRRECLEHVVVLGERHLRRILTAYFAYYHRTRTHLSLDKDAPDGGPIEPPELGGIIRIPEVGGLHHRYVRRAA